MIHGGGGGGGGRGNGRGGGGVGSAAPGEGGGWEEEEEEVAQGVAEADRDLDREWYESDEGGHAVDASHDPFMGDEGLYAKREEAMKKRVNHRAVARARDADRWVGWVGWGG
jgi:hypothetical protein